MHFLDEATHAMLNREAYRNGWKLLAVAALPESSGTVETKGVVMFSHNDDQKFGLADYVGDKDTSITTYHIHFSRGSYDLTRETALSDFCVRVKDWS